MFNIKITSRIKALNYVPLTNKEIAISINGTFFIKNNEITILNSKFVDVLYLDFDDIDKPVKDLIFFNKNHAKQIIDFILKYKDDITTILIHCAAGMSRSAAVGIFVDKYFCNEYNRILNKKPFYNRHVLSLLENVYFFDNIKK